MKRMLFLLSAIFSLFACGNNELHYDCETGELCSEYGIGTLWIVDSNTSIVYQMHNSDKMRKKRVRLTELVKYFTEIKVDGTPAKFEFRANTKYEIENRTEPDAHSSPITLYTDENRNVVCQQESNTQQTEAQFTEGQTLCEHDSSAYGDCEMEIDRYVMHIMDDYISQHKYESYLLVTDFEYNWRDEKSEADVELLFGPAYKGLCGTEGGFRNYPASYKIIRGHHVFIQSSIDTISHPDSMADIYDRHAEPVGSVEMDGTLGIVSKTAMWQFLSHAIVIEARKDTAIILPEHADSIIGKRRVEFELPPVQ